MVSSRVRWRSSWDLELHKDRAENSAKSSLGTDASISLFLPVGGCVLPEMYWRVIVPHLTGHPTRSETQYFEDMRKGDSLGRLDMCPNTGLHPESLEHHLVRPLFSSLHWP